MSFSDPDIFGVFARRKTTPPHPEGRQGNLAYRHRKLECGLIYAPSLCPCRPGGRQLLIRSTNEPLRASSGASLPHCQVRPVDVHVQSVGVRRLCSKMTACEWWQCGGSAGTVWGAACVCVCLFVCSQTPEAVEAPSY